MGHSPISLVGMMGAGKSALGPQLAARLARRFVDTDRLTAPVTVDEISRRLFAAGVCDRATEKEESS